MYRPLSSENMTFFARPAFPRRLCACWAKKRSLSSTKPPSASNMNSSGICWSCCSFSSSSSCPIKQLWAMRKQMKKAASFYFQCKRLTSWSSSSSSSWSSEESWFSGGGGGGGGGGCSCCWSCGLSDIIERGRMTSSTCKRVPSAWNVNLVDKHFIVFAPMLWHTLCYVLICLSLILYSQLKISISCQKGGQARNQTNMYRLNFQEVSYCSMKWRIHKHKYT